MAALFLATPWVVAAQDDLASSKPELSTHALLQKIREHVLRQVQIGGNYMCVQTADRHYFIPKEATQFGCSYQLKHPEKTTEIMTDRLRLAVAVSENQEIYSWYGQTHFGSGAIDEVVTAGPITSGGFGGFLRNIFLSAGIEFTYDGHTVLNDLPEDAFDYHVPLARSTYTVTTDHGPVLIAYRGSVSVNSNTFELTKLIVEVLDGPPSSTVCHARSVIDYQIQHISGNDVLIPSRFDFKVESTDHSLTDSTFEYQSCHAFTGESTISYAISGATNPAADTAPPIVKGPLPPRQLLYIAVHTPINDRDSYTGDPVVGQLLHAVKLDEANEVIPKGALVSGFVNELDFYPHPAPHYQVDVLFNKIVDGNTTYRMRALHLLSPGDSPHPYSSYNPLARATPEPLTEHGKHFELRAGYKSEWMTVTVKSAKNSEAP